MTRCLGAPVPVNGFRHVCSNTVSVLVTRTDIVQCRRMSLGGSKLSQPQRFNAFAIAVLCLLPSCPSSSCVTADLRPTASTTTRRSGGWRWRNFCMRGAVMLLLLWVMCTRWSQNGINGRQAVRIKFTSMALALLCFLYINLALFGRGLLQSGL